MRIRITANGKTQEIPQIVPSVSWSGDYKQVARTLNFAVLSSPTDKTIPVIDCSLGASVQMEIGGEVLFDGFIVTRTKSTERSVIDITCYDRGFYLKRNNAIERFDDVPADAITAKLCGDFNIKLGYAAPTGIPITRIFSTGNDSLYNIILTAYTLSSQSTGKAYHIGFRGDSLYVTTKEPDDRTLIIAGGSNLISASTTESIENTVSTVRIYDKNDNIVQTLDDSERLRLYGRLQEIVKQTDKDDKFAEAQKILSDRGMEQKITLQCLGNVANVTGGTVVVKEPYTVIYGLFYIDSDLHEWKRGQYYNKLTLNFKAIMDEKEAGNLPNATGAKTSAISGGQVPDGYSWKYDYYGNPRAGGEQ